MFLASLPSGDWPEIVSSSNSSSPPSCDFKTSVDSLEAGDPSVFGRDETKKDGKSERTSFTLCLINLHYHLAIPCHW